MKHQPERTCIGCRKVFHKDELIRIVGGPAGIVVDYREKLSGRAAYVCPRTICIQKALSKDNMARALHLKVKTPSGNEFSTRLAAAILEKIKSLIVMSAKAGKLAAGYSAVHDALDKGRVHLLLFARDISDGTREKVTKTLPSSFRQSTVLTRDELGRLLNRELVGVIAIEDSGLADALWREAERLKDLININE
jgi:predicted RNA-binding protein YlxR (DUF448 family)/ribosomal protein L30E